MSKAIPADPVCTRTGSNFLVANAATSKTTSVAGDANCRYMAGGQTVTPEPSN